MNNYVLEVNTGQANSAGVKAKQDIGYFLKKENFIPINVHVPKSKIKRFLFGKKICERVLNGVKEGTFVFQYPMYSNIISKYIIDILKQRKNLKLILVIHDIESLRLHKDERNIVAKEVNFFNRFDKVITHNKKMTNWLVNNGLKVKTSELEIFDYNNPHLISKPTISKKIMFAGNLEKSVFLEKLHINTDISIMGPTPSKNYPRNIEYLGIFSPEDVPLHLKEGFGLVWDGDSVDTCRGIYGNYMRFNNPHKVSLYISSGIPVIIWAKSAMAEFVLENKVGLVINSLNDLDKIMENLTECEYSNLVRNVDRIATKLRNGEYIHKAIFNG